MIYLWLKALHVGFAFIWFGGLISLCVAVSAWLPISGITAPQEKRIGQVILKWDRCITVPSMAATWIIGICLASLGGWFGVGWLNTKLIFALLLSGMHGVLSGSLRRRILSADPIRSRLRNYSVILCLLGIMIIALMVIIKPVFGRT